MLTVTNYDRRKAAMNETTQTTTTETDATMTSSAAAFDVESQREEQHDNETVEEENRMQDRQRCFRFLPPTSKLVEMLCTGSAPPRSPSKLKMAVLTFLMIWIQVHFLVQAYSSLPALSSYPLAVEAVTIFTVVFSTEFLWMPIAMFVLSFWLFPKPKQRKDDDEQKLDRKQQQDDSEQSTISMTVRSREEPVE